MVYFIGTLLLLMSMDSRTYIVSLGDGVRGFCFQQRKKHFSSYKFHTGRLQTTSYAVSTGDAFLGVKG